MLAERVGNPLFELSVCNRAREFGLFGAASLRLRIAGVATVAAAPHLGWGALLLVTGAPLAFAEALVDPVAAAGVQAAGGGRGGQTVAVPVVAELLLQSRGQRVHGVPCRPLIHVRARGRAGLCTQQQIRQPGV